MNDPGLPLASDEPGPGVQTRLSLSARQRAFQQMLKELRDGRLAEWYMGALTVLSQESNPDRFAQAAHSMSALTQAPDKKKSSKK